MNTNTFLWNSMNRCEEIKAYVILKGREDWKFFAADSYKIFHPGLSKEDRNEWLWGLGVVGIAWK